jgi:hypothetical protein
MEQRDYTWSSIFAWGLTLSGATLATGGVIGMFWPHLNIGWMCVAAFAGMMAFGIGLVNCAASGAMHAIKHRKLDGGRVDWAVLLPALACCVGFAFATNIGVHMGWEIVKINAPAGANLPPAATIDLVFYIFAFAKPAMAWIVEGRKAMDAETMAARQVLRRKEAADMAAAEVALEAARAETARSEVARADAPADATPAGAAAPETKSSRARRAPKTEEELREIARKAVARRAAAFRDLRMTTHVQAVELARQEPPLTPLQIAQAADRLLKLGEKPTLPRVAEVMGVSRERVEQTWPKGVPLDGTGELRVA